ncbi:hypothetical protein BDA96_10G150300 [Sorghum bicolor]|uniref:Uncharacterized protein n=2 Tax=Sorghum bicolor TaxID=4558 RepID=A0A921U0Z8_SORBI|nr:hypothetical protein BDA96_10G150300 [Sorghum bicolor]KXG19819.1 hypothetical protein SORBI_3010G121900 [Sorghum bicolor]
MSWWRNDNNGGSHGSSVRSTLLDLQLCLALHTGRVEVDHGNDSDLSSPCSCVSSNISSNESLVLILGGCRQCWRYFMVSKKEFPTCINCKQPYLISFNSNEKHNYSK